MKSETRAPVDPLAGRQGGSRRWRLIGRSFTRNRTAMFGAGFIVLAALLAVLAPWVVIDPIHLDYDAITQPPSLSHPFGTDEVGRDTLSRVIYGARVSLQVGIMAVVVACTVGVVSGIAAGYYGGWVDSVIMRTVDAILALPGLLLAIFLVGVMGPSLRNAMLAISVTFIPVFARLSRAQTLAIREMEYVEGARAIGAGNWRIMLTAVLPNLQSTIIVQLSLAMSFAILTEAGLSFLGLGIQPPTPAWGSMLGEARNYITVAWWLTAFPGLAIFLTVISFNFIGDGLREALDPRQRRL